MRTYDDSDPVAGYGFGDSGRGGGSVRRVVLIAAVVVVGLCVAFLAGYSARGDGDARAGASPRPSLVVASIRATGPTVTASESSPAAAPPSAAPGAGVALRRNPEGVIVGYSDDQAGAVAAAGNYTASLYVQTNRTHARELAVLSSIAASAADATRMAGDFSSEDAALAQLLDVASLQSAGVIAYGHPQGYRVESTSAAAATVDVYVAGGQGVADAPDDSGAAGQTFYEVDQVRLVWQQGDWALTDWSHLVEDDGPQLGSIAAEGYQPFPIGVVSGA